MAIKIRAFIFSLLILFPLSLQSAEYIVKELCFAKGKPIPDAMIMFVLEPGLHVSSIQEENGWILVTYNKNNKLSGWVPKDDLKSIAPDSVKDKKIEEIDSIRISEPQSFPVSGKNEISNANDG